MSLQLKLRQTTPNDYQETENVIREAFWNVYEPGCSDHYLVHIMRQSDTFIPELDIVATLNDKIIGNVVYSTAILKADNGENYPVLALGPIGILPEYHRQQVGSKLIDFSRNIAKKMDYRATFCRQLFLARFYLAILNSIAMKAFFLPKNLVSVRLKISMLMLIMFVNCIPEHSRIYLVVILKIPFMTLSRKL